MCAVTTSRQLGAIPPSSRSAFSRARHFPRIGATIATALLIAVPARVAAADAIAAFDAFSVKRAIISKCHQSQDAADRAYLAKGETLRRAAASELRAKLDASDPAHKAENARKADETLKHQIDARDFDIDEQIRNYGCDWLDGMLYSGRP